MLGGNVHDETIWDRLGLDEAAERAISAGEIPPLIIILPDGGDAANQTSGGPFSFEGVVLSDLIPFVESNYCAWAAADGRAIGGLSRGGYWALEIAFRHPELFSSVGGHSAALLDIAAGPAENPLFTGPANDLGRLRIYLDVGESDYLRPSIEPLHQALLTAGKSHTWLLNEGAHEEAYWMAHLVEYLTWYAEPWPRLRAVYPACE
jgi:enterochelin esterase-like enzyme